MAGEGLTRSSVKCSSRSSFEKISVVAVEAPAEQRQVVHQRLGQVALAAELLHRRRAVPLRELAAARREDQRHVRELRRVPAERLVELDVDRRGRDPLVAAHDVGDLHVVIVDHVAEVVGREAVRLEQDQVLDQLRSGRPSRRGSGR